MSSEGFAQMTSPAPEDVFGVWHETLLRVRYAETDKMGIVYYANYLVWFEIGRTDYCRARGFSYRDMKKTKTLSWLSPSRTAATKLPPTTTMS
jgi:hypothetical protein